MLKWSLILNILFLALTASSCVISPEAPNLARQPKQYIHAGEPDTWCRLNGEHVECVEDLRKYGLYHVDDISMIQTYLFDLNEKCEKWSDNGF